VEIPALDGLLLLLEVNEVLGVFVVLDVTTRIGPVDEVLIVPEVTTNRAGSVASLFGEPTTDMSISPVERYVPTTKLPEILPFVIVHVCEAMLSVGPPET
jgi:hypothetical protein